MRKITLFTLIMTVVSTMLVAQMKPEDASTIKKSNPLVQDWNTPYQTPPFDKIKTEHYKPAILYSLDQAKKDVNAIIENKEKPSFENTIVALENAGSLLNRVLGVFFNINEANTSNELQKIAEEMSPELTRYSNDINMNPELFAKVKKVYDSKDDIPLTTEQRMLLDKTYKGFLKSGALLEGNQKEEFRKISEELSLLSLKYQKNNLSDQNAYMKVITNKKDLAGIPQYAIDAAKETAKQRKVKGWVFTLDYPSYLPFITYADNRELRKELWTASNKVANNNNENDNKENIIKIANLRLRMAQLLGYSSYAEYALTDRMAENPTKVLSFIDNLLESSMPFAKKDLQMVTDYAHSKGFVGDIQRWDWSYWSEKLKNEKFSINPEMTKPYFQLEKVREGIFMLADKLYGLEFRENKDITKYHEDVVTYEVWDKANNKFMAILYMDFFPRESKRSGAWMTSFREQKIENNEDVRPLIQMVCNFTKPTAKTPSLLTFDEYNTFLHEFGHCLHGMLSECTYQSTSGTSVYRDFVELPSQIMENFATEKEFLDMFAVHYQTGEKIPEDLIKKIKASEQYLQGYSSVRQLFLGLVDMGWNNTKELLKGDVESIERKSSKKADLLPIVEGSIMSTQFGHIFAGGYAAGYYGYKWAEVLDADAYSLFKEKGIFNKEVSTSFRNNVLSKGGKKHPMELYKAFRGQEPTNKALLIRSGFIK
ncbi:MAG: M3 family metallopeptidase [Bacteroidales bacterium]|nr:M3 family metallopeptidase [Bacteroidales bacterium]MDD4528857.1 M3 family metallopeptidase [Bacteroidales bacterium]MDD4830059.1 M3 family metallopeptidase [Bacteroidales bacterium]